MFNNEDGQTLMELIVVIAVSVIIIGALVFATITSLRNAQFSKNQAQATKRAQEGIEIVRSVRDRDIPITTSIVYPDSSPARNIDKFSELFSVDLSNATCNTTSGDAPCYFKISGASLIPGASNDFETVDLFQRQILIGDETDSKDTQKTVTVIVKWVDFSGDHESKLTTILRNIL